MPYPNEHSCRLEDPDKYENFRREKCGEKHDGKCIDVIYGIKEGKSEIQALRYKTDIWDEDDARAHCKEREGKFEPAGDEESEVLSEEKYQCECIECGYEFESDEHCRDVKCPECGGDCRRVERPGPGQRSNFQIQEGSGMSAERREYREFEMDKLEVRAAEGEDAPKKIIGHGAVYNKLSVDLGGFKELFEPGTFAESIKRDDIRSLRDHTPTYILGRTKAGTLELKEDERGVYYEVVVPETSYADDLLISIERGDVTGCSIMFQVDGEKGERWFLEGKEVDAIDAFMAMWDEKKHKIERHVNKARLYDIGPVTFPAYPQTDVKARSLAAVAGLDYEALGTALVKSQRGLPLDEIEQRTLAKAGDIISGRKEAEEKSADAEDIADKPDGQGALKGRALSLARRRLNYGYPNR